MRITRRDMLATTGVAVIGVALMGCSNESSNSSVNESDQPVRWMMPDEGAKHSATWMSLQVDDNIWGRKLATATRRTLETIAETIGRYEPVKALVASKANSTPQLKNVELIEQAANDLWIRDTGPTFVRGSGILAGVDFNFNGWGNKQEHQQDALVAKTVISTAKVSGLSTELVLEGGALEVDGEGTAIMTESCVLNKNRNPGWSKAKVEAELERLLGIRKIIWLPGIVGRDITDGHTDFYARFAGPGVVVAGRDDDPKSFDYQVTRQHLEILQKATDAAGRRLELHVIPGPSTVRPDYESDDFAAGYINFYVCNGAVISPEFGDPQTDAFARQTLTKLFPDREIVQLNIDPVAAGGGGIHCATQQQPEKA